MCACVCVCVCACVCVCMSVQVWVYMHVWYIFVCVYEHVCYAKFGNLAQSFNLVSLNHFLTDESNQLCRSEGDMSTSKALMVRIGLLTHTTIHQDDKDLFTQRRQFP